jgi:DNA-binding transcriptional MerR regulator
MLRYLEQAGLVVPSRTPAGYRLYGLRELNQLRALADLRSRFGLGIGDIAFAARLRREPSSAPRSTAGSPTSRTHPGSSGSNENTNDFSPHNERN